MLETSINALTAAILQLAAAQGGTPVTPTPTPVTPTPTPGTGTPAPTPTPVPTPAPTGLKIASAPNALAYDRHRTSSTDTHRLVTFPVFLGEYPTSELSFAFHNSFVGSDQGNLTSPGNAVRMHGMKLTSPLGESKSFTDVVNVPWQERGFGPAFKPSDFGLSEFPANQLWFGQATVSVVNAGDSIPGHINIGDKQHYTAFFMDSQGGNRTQVYREVPVPHVLGKVSGNAKSFLLLGDSWNRGNDTVSGEQNSSYALGVMSDVGEKAMVNRTTGRVIPFINASRYGFSLNGAFNPLTDPRMLWVPNVTDVVDATGYNETGQGLETVLANHKKLRDAVKALNPTARIWVQVIIGQSLGAFTTGYEVALNALLASGEIAGIIRMDNIRNPANRALVVPGFLNPSDHPLPGVGVEAVAQAYKIGIGL